MVVPYKNEKTLFTIACAISAIVWLVLLVVTFGLILVYGLLAFLIYLFVQSGFISYLKGTGVLITPEQFPDIHHRLQACCQRTGVDPVPDAYLLRTDFFNALATRFLGRNFIVLFTDVLDALEDRPGAVNFYIGHELGHIHRKHLQWGWFIMPASILPLLGAGLRRAEEYTCDRYGVACCDSDDDVRAAIAAIAAGNTRWKSINADAYIRQIAVTGGFWMSFNELTSDYPWLTKRMGRALAYRRGEEFFFPRRHWFAKLLALFIPRIGIGGGSGLLITIVMLGILAAVALPAYQDYTARAYIAESLSEASVLQTQLENYYDQQGTWPEPFLTNIGYDTDDPLMGPSGNYSLDIYPDGMIGINVSTLLAGNEQYVVLEPTVQNGQVTWICYGQDVEQRYLPSTCQ
jgi:Zn-dependent protease with chaperone function/type II secretory pathway pseudopilin PulG